MVGVSRVRAAVVVAMVAVVASAVVSVAHGHAARKSSVFKDFPGASDVSSSFGMDSHDDTIPTLHPNSVRDYFETVKEDEEEYDEEYEDYEDEDEQHKAKQKEGHAHRPSTSKPHSKGSSGVPSSHGTNSNSKLSRPQIISKLRTFTAKGELPIGGGSGTPVFVEEPVDSYVVRGKSALLVCRVAAADKVYFTCNGEAMAESELHREADHVVSAEEIGAAGPTASTMSTLVVKEVTLEVRRNDIEEFFGHFSCRCDAWSAKGMVSSKNVSVETAYLRKEFEVPPYSQTVELGTQIELRCHPPSGKPKPRIYWLRDRVEVKPERDSNYLVAADGHLILIQARDKDRANYTCVAENVANRRLSPPARLNVIVSGGWSEWTAWSACTSTSAALSSSSASSSASAQCGPGVQRRERFCNSPAPRLGGPYCQGIAFEKIKCNIICKDGVYDPRTAITAVSGGWSGWSGWSGCGVECARGRKRTCDDPEPVNGGAFCDGQDEQHEDCTGGLCRGKRQTEVGKAPAPGDQAHQEILETDFSLLVGLSVALAVFLLVTLASIKLLRKKGRSPSIYTMTNLNYRREFSGKSNGAKQDEAAKLLVESRLSDNSNNSGGSLQQQQQMAVAFGDTDAVNLTVNPLGNPNGGSMCLVGGMSPFADGRSASKRPLLASALTLSTTAGEHPSPFAHAVSRPKSPSNMSEHQYDIPFSHLLRQNMRSAVAVSSAASASSSQQQQPMSAPVSRRRGAARNRKRLSLESNSSDELAAEMAAANEDATDIEPDYDVADPPRLCKPNRKAHLQQPQMSVMGNGGSHRSGRSLVSNDSSLLMPRLVNGSTGLFSPLRARTVNVWSGSESSLYSESSQLPSCFGEPQGHSVPPVYSCQSVLSTASSSFAIDPECFTFASVDHTGHILALPDLGVRLTIPEGALEKGYTEEVFLAVMTEGRDRPRLSENQTLLSPVVLVGPPRLAFKKPVVVSFGHCANLRVSPSHWELGVYHCDSLFASDADDTPWLKLATIGQESHAAAPVAATLDADVCHIVTDFLSRFCIVGQSVASTASLNTLDADSGLASKMLRVSVLAKPSPVGANSTISDLLLGVMVCDDTTTAIERCLRFAEKQGFSFLITDPPRSMAFRDGGSDLAISLSEVTPDSSAYSMRPRTQQSAVPFAQVWSDGLPSSFVAFCSLHRTADAASLPASFAFNLTLLQRDHAESAHVYSATLDVSRMMVISTSSSSPSPRLPQRAPSRLRAPGAPAATSTTSSSSSSASSRHQARREHRHTPQPQPPARMSHTLRSRLCLMLDAPATSGLNDWRALCAGLRLERFSDFFAAKASPSDCILTLWEAQADAAAGHDSGEQPRGPTELINVLRRIGRQDCVTVIEQEMGAWT